MRLFQYYESGRILLKSKFVGVGMGNWFNEAYNFMVTDSLGHEANDLYRHNCHSLYALVLVESGIVGFILFCWPICYILKSTLGFYLQLETFYKCCLYSLLVYFVACFYYLSAFTVEGYFSGLQVLAYINMAILYVRITSIHSS